MPLHKTRTILSFAVCLLFVLAIVSYGQKAPKTPDQKAITAETVAETVIYVYGGRQSFDTVRVNGIERANVTLPTTGGDRTGQLITRFIRKDKSWLDFKRIDLSLQDSDSVSLGFNGVKLWASLNGLPIEPRPEAAKTFQASLIHSYTALLRYREDGSKVELKGQQTIKGLECHVLLMTHEDGSTTTFYISTKSFKILHLDYEVKLTGDTPTKFRVSYFEYKSIQSNVVPMRTEVYENGQLSQRIVTTGVTFNIALDDDVFNHA